MSLDSMTKAVSHQLLQALWDTTFVQKFVFKPKSIQEKVESASKLSALEVAKTIQTIFNDRYQTVHDIAIALNEFIDRSNGGIPIELSKDVEWDGFINGTEEEIKCLLSKGTYLTVLEFLEAPAEGLIFQLTLGEGPEGKHFNIPMDDALDASDNLLEVVQMAHNLRIEDRMMGIDVDTMIKDLEKEEPNDSDN